MFFHTPNELCLGIFSAFWSEQWFLWISTCKKLSDGKGIGGKARVTSVKIDTFQNLYGLAIKSNKGNSEAMSKATLVILYHYMEQANHEYCPKGINS